jgi:hypothetical protein
MAKDLPDMGNITTLKWKMTHIFGVNYGNMERKNANLLRGADLAIRVVEGTDRNCVSAYVHSSEDGFLFATQVQMPLLEE